MSDWEFVKRRSHISKLFRNRITGKHCEQYVLSLYSDQEKRYFEQRVCCTSPFLVKVVHFECFSCFDQANVFIHYNARVFVQHIRFRLSEMIEVPDNYLLGLLEDTLEGFKVVFEEYQPVRIAENMICINEDRRIKVWLSTNLLENCVNPLQVITEQTIVNDIFNIFRRFSKMCDDRPANIDFNQAIDYIHLKKSKHTKKVVGLGVPTSVDYAPKKPINQKMYKTSDRFNVCPLWNTNHISIPRRQNTTQFQLSSQLYDSPNKSQIVNNHSNAYINHTNTSYPQMRDDSLEKHQVLSSIDKTSFAPDMYDSQDDVSGKRRSIVVRIESARTTSKNIVNQKFVELDRNELQLELLDQKKTKQTKLDMIENALSSKPHDKNVQKICKIYNHALKYDPLMYLELQKHQGRISKISNMYVIKKLIEITERDSDEQSELQSKYKDNKAGRLKPHDQLFPIDEQEKRREERVRQILETQRSKRNKTIYNKVTGHPTSMNKTSPNPSKTSIEQSPNPLQKQKELRRRPPSYISELESLIGPSFESERQKYRTGSNNHQIEQKKKEKNKLMRGFKEQVQKLLFD